MKNDGKIKCDSINSEMVENNGEITVISLTGEVVRNHGKISADQLFVERLEGNQPVKE